MAQKNYCYRTQTIELYFEIEVKRSVCFLQKYLYLQRPLALTAGSVSKKPFFLGRKERPQEVFYAFEKNRVLNQR
jgi:hypothetical protein